MTAPLPDLCRPAENIRISKTSNNMQKHRENIKKHTPLFALMFLLMALSFCRYGAPVHAQAATVTPLPGPVATATAAAFQLTQAQAQQAQAAQLAQQAQAAQQAASTLYQQAQQAAADARAALAAQQYQHAGELLGQAESLNATGREQLTILSTANASLQGIANSQYMTLTQQADELQQVRSELAQQKAIIAALQANNATLTQKINDGAQAGGTLNYAWLLGVLLLIILLIGFAAWRIDKRRGEVTIIRSDAEQVDSEVIEDEDQS